MTKNILISICVSLGLIIGSILVAPNVEISAADVTATGKVYNRQITTSYWPGGASMEGGLGASRPGLDGQSLARTLEDFRLGKSSYVTVAADPNWYGAKFLQKEFSYVNAKGESHTLKNVVFYVHDTGSLFNIKNVDKQSKYHPNPCTNLQDCVGMANKRLRKFDIAYDKVSSDAEGSRNDRRQPPKSNEWIPLNDKAANPPVAEYNGKYGRATVGGESIRDGSAPDFSGQTFETTEGQGGVGQSPGAPCPPRQQSATQVDTSRDNEGEGRDSKPRTGGSGPSFINKEDLRTRLTEKIKTSKLNGYVPSDGAFYGITTGSPEQWANYLTELAGKESSYNNNTVGDKDVFVGDSNGLFQLSPNDAKWYNLNGGKPFTKEQLKDAETNINAAISIHESLVIKSNSIKSGAGRYWGPVGRGWLPYVPPNLPVTNYDGTATGGNDDRCWCKTDPNEYNACKNQKVVIGMQTRIIPNLGGKELWSTSPYCYKHITPPGGPQVHYLAFTCNGGIKIDGRRSRYVPDCGFNNSVGCSEWASRMSGTAGCLWAICKGGNAIWDPQTLKCGCDDGTFLPATESVLVIERTESEFDERHQYVDPRCSPGGTDWGSSVPRASGDLDNIYGSYNNHKTEIEPNLVTIKFQGKNLTVHKYAAQALAEMDKEIQATHPGEYTIKNTYAYDHRTKNTRQGAKNEPSQHAYGIAFDINASDMPVKTVTPDTNTVPQWFVNIASKHGFKWGGNFSKNYYDPMHFQYTGGKEYWNKNGGKLPDWLSYKDANGVMHNGGSGSVAIETPLGTDKLATNIPNCRQDQDIRFNEQTNKCECVNRLPETMESSDYPDYSGGEVPPGYTAGASEYKDLNSQVVKERWGTFNDNQKASGSNARIDYTSGSFKLDGFPEKGQKYAEELALASDSTLRITSARRGTSGNHAFGSFDLGRNNPKLESYIRSKDTSPVKLYDKNGNIALKYTYVDSSGNTIGIIDEPNGWGGNSGPHWHVDPNNGKYRNSSK